jgi:transcriptional regulator with XRE-family HTH domain
MKSERIRALVKELTYLRDETLLDLSKSTGISYTSIRNFTKGRTELKYGTTVDIFNALDIDLEQLMIDALLKSVQEKVQSKDVIKLHQGVAPWPLNQ